MAVRMQPVISVPACIAALLIDCAVQARADLAEDASNLTPATEAAFAATLIGPTDPLPLPVLTSLPGMPITLALHVV